MDGPAEGAAMSVSGVRSCHLSRQVVEVKVHAQPIISGLTHL